MQESLARTIVEGDAGFTEGSTLMLEREPSTGLDSWMPSADSFIHFSYLLVLSFLPFTSSIGHPDLSCRQYYP